MGEGIHPKAFQIWYVDFPFIEDPTSSKKRTALILDWDGDKCVALMTKITSKLWHNEPGDVVL